MSSKFSCKKVVSISKRVNRELSNAFELQGKDMFTVSLTEQNQCTYSPYCSLYISQSRDKESLFNNQELL